MTKKELLKLGFKDLGNNEYRKICGLALIYVTNKRVDLVISFGTFKTNAHTMEDIHDLIRLFK